MFMNFKDTTENDEYICNILYRSISTIYAFRPVDVIKENSDGTIKCKIAFDRMSEFQKMMYYTHKHQARVYKNNCFCRKPNLFNGFI